MCKNNYNYWYIIENIKYVHNIIIFIGMKKMIFFKNFSSNQKSPKK